MDRKAKVLTALKPKVKQLGFNRKELQGIAAAIADKLESAEDASEEDLDTEISDLIEAQLPLLAVTQSYANRLAEAARRRDAEEDEEEEGEKPKPAKKTKGEETGGSALLEALNRLTAKVEALEKGKKTDSRTKRMEELLKDAGPAGKAMLGQFRRMSFESDEDFEEFISETEEAIKNLGTPNPGPGGTPPGVPKGKGAAPKPLSEEEIEALTK